MQLCYWVGFRISLSLSRKGAIFRDEIENYFSCLARQDRDYHITILLFWDDNEITYCYSRVSRPDRDFGKSFLMVEQEKMKLTLVENSQDREFSLKSEENTLDWVSLFENNWGEVPYLLASSSRVRLTISRRKEISGMCKRCEVEGASHSTATEKPWIHFISSWLKHRVTEGTNHGLDSWFTQMCHRSAFLMSHVLDISSPKNLSINFATDHNFKDSSKCALRSTLLKICITQKLTFVSYSTSKRNM